MSNEIRIDEQLRLARTMNASGNRWGAKEIFQSILITQPDNTSAHFELSQLLLTDGNLSLALLHASFAFNLDQNLPGLARHTADLYYYAGLYSQAKCCYLIAIKSGDCDSQCEERLEMCEQLSAALKTKVSEH